MCNLKYAVICIFLLTTSCTIGNAQDLETAELIADETTAEITKTNKLKIVTYNETIANKIITHYYKCECIKYTFSFEKNKNHKDPKWTITLPGDKKQEIVASLNKK